MDHGLTILVVFLILGIRQEAQVAMEDPVMDTQVAAVDQAISQAMQVAISRAPK